MKKKRNNRTPKAKKRITLGKKWDIDSEQLSEPRTKVRRVLHGDGTLGDGEHSAAKE